MQGVHSCKRSGEGINKNVLAVTRDLSAGNEGPGEEDKGGKCMQWCRAGYLC